ncbi:MAG: TIGR00730 family Rossman fold protein [Afipia sp.]|nr:TIGR00730 family Rossman fold protein [Afipia sp.]
MSIIKSICVYCGSSPGNNPRFIEAATEFGKILAENRINLVYGGGSRGMMGAVATSALKHGGTVTGIIPKSLVELEHALRSVQEMIVTEDMHERKRLMFEHSDAFVALPGGIGTLEELVEQLTWAQLMHHTKPIVCCSIDGYWTPLLETLTRMKDSGFVYNAGILDGLICEGVAEILPTLKRKAASAVRKTEATSA